MNENELASGDESSETLVVCTRSLVTAYLLLPVGAHRFYLGNWLGGLLIIFLALIFIGIGLEIFGIFYLAMLTLEAVLLPAAVRKKNAALSAEMLMHPERFLIPDEDHIALWARGKDRRSGLGWRQAALRTMIFFIILPGATGFFAAELHSLELLIIPLVLLVAIGLVSSLDRTLIRYPTLLEVPGVGPALERVAEMRAHYWEHEPKVLSAYWGLFRHAFTHYKPYWGLASIVLATVVIEGFISWEDNTNYIPYGEAALIVGITALIAAAAMLFNLVPVTALAFHYSLTGKTARLRFMILGALIATILGYQISSEEIFNNGTGQTPSYLSAKRLDARMEDKIFQGQLQERLEFFLNFYVGKNYKPDYIRSKLVSLLQGIAPNDEPVAFGVLQADNWMAVTRYHASGACFINPTNGEIQGSDKLPVKTINSRGEEVDEFPTQFSLLALVYKRATDEKVALFVDRLEEGYEIPEILEELGKKITFYSWGQMSEDEKSFFRGVIPEACQSLLCEDEGNCASEVQLDSTGAS